MQAEPRPPRAAAVIVAAGNSTRMNAARAPGQPALRKPRLELGGVPILEHTLAAFDATPGVEEIILVAHPDDVEEYRRRAAERAVYQKLRAVVPGGEERFDSVRLGVRWCSFEVETIAVHDAARPLVRPEWIQASIEGAARSGAALVAMPVQDTIKVSPGGQLAEQTLDRSVLWCAQTPQTFDARRFRELLKRAAAEGFCPTDDAALWERYVGPVQIVRGDSTNLKITTPADLELAAALLRQRKNSERP